MEILAREINDEKLKSEKIWQKVFRGRNKQVFKTVIKEKFCEIKWSLKSNHKTYPNKTTRLQDYEKYFSYQGKNFQFTYIWERNVSIRILTSNILCNIKLSWRQHMGQGPYIQPKCPWSINITSRNIQKCRESCSFLRNLL